MVASLVPDSRRICRYSTCSSSVERVGRISPDSRPSERPVCLVYFGQHTGCGYWHAFGFGHNGCVDFSSRGVLERPRKICRSHCGRIGRAKPAFHSGFLSGNSLDMVPSLSQWLQSLDCKLSNLAWSRRNAPDDQNCRTSNNQQDAFSVSGDSRFRFHPCRK